MQRPPKLPRFRTCALRANAPPRIWPNAGATLNRALRPRELRPFVERLAYRIASFPAEAIALAKRAVNAAELPTVEGLLEETDCFNRSLPTAAARRRMARFLELGGQTREEELALGGRVERLGE